MNDHVVALEPRARFRLWVRFADGVEGAADLSDIVGRGVFSRWTEHPEQFRAVTIDPTTGAPSWPGSLDVAPDALHSEIVRALQTS